MKEAQLQNDVRLEASRLGMRLWRNNVGVAVNRNGRPVRYGLCNDSAAMNKQLKSSDLIGIQPVLITEDMVGTTIGQFVAYECKAPGWTLKNTEHEQAQQRFIALVISLGGMARFISDIEELT